MIPRCFRLPAVALVIGMLFTPAADLGVVGPSGAGVVRVLAQDDDASTSDPEMSDDQTNTPDENGPADIVVEDPPTVVPEPPPSAPSPLPAPPPPPPARFTCTLFVGYSQTDNWFAAAEAVLGTEGYEELWNSGGAAHLWADPGYAGWRNAMQSPCLRAANSPDRVVLDITHDAYLTPAATGATPVGYMERIIRSVVATTRSRYPSARLIVLQPIVGGPNHATCPWPGAQEGVVRATYNHPVIHDAINRVIGGDVVMGPDSSVRTCADYRDDGGHLTASAAGPIGQRIAQYYQGS